MKLILVSKYFIPDQSIDASSASELIRELRVIDPDIEIHVITSNNNYKNNLHKLPKSRESIDYVYIHRIKSFYSGNNKMLLLIGAIIDGLRMTIKAKNLPIQSIITLTNPPLISFWYAIFLQKKKWIYWTFDLYPEALSASNILSEKNFLFRYFARKIYKSAPSGLIALGEQQKNFLLEKYGTDIPTVILPCGILSKEPLAKDRYPSWYQSNKRYIGYIGNLGKAHSKEFLIEAINSINNLPHDYLFVLTVYGEHKKEIESLVAKLRNPNIISVPHVEPIHLQLIDIQLVSLRDKWTHVSVPSKAVSAVCSGSCLCFYGSVETDTWNMFKDCSFLISDLSNIPFVFSSFTPKLVDNKKQNAQLIAKKLIIEQKQAFRSVYKNLLD